MCNFSLVVSSKMWTFIIFLGGGGGHLVYSLEVGRHSKKKEKWRRHRCFFWSFEFAYPVEARHSLFQLKYLQS
jgi:hypothetical protein